MCCICYQSFPRSDNLKSHKKVCKKRYLKPQLLRQIEDFITYGYISEPDLDELVHRILEQKFNIKNKKDCFQEIHCETLNEKKRINELYKLFDDTQLKI